MAGLATVQIWGHTCRREETNHRAREDGTDLQEVVESRVESSVIGIVMSVDGSGAAVTSGVCLHPQIRRKK